MSEAQRMYGYGGEPEATSPPRTKVSRGLTMALDEQENSVEELQAIVGDLLNAIDGMMKPMEPETKPDFTEAMPNWSPIVGRVRVVERRINRTHQLVAEALARLDA